MDLYAVIDQVASLLQRHGRVSYRSIQLQFSLTAEQLAGSKRELTAVRGRGRQRRQDAGVEGRHGIGAAPSEAHRLRPPLLPVIRLLI